MEAVHAALVDHSATGQPLTAAEFHAHVELPLFENHTPSHALLDCARVHGSLKRSPGAAPPCWPSPTKRARPATAPPRRPRDPRPAPVLGATTLHFVVDIVLRLIESSSSPTTLRDLCRTTNLDRQTMSWAVTHLVDMKAAARDCIGRVSPPPS